MFMVNEGYGGGSGLERGWIAFSRQNDIFYSLLMTVSNCETMKQICLPSPLQSTTIISEGSRHRHVSTASLLPSTTILLPSSAILFPPLPFSSTTSSLHHQSPLPHRSPIVMSFKTPTGSHFEQFRKLALETAMSISCSPAWTSELGRSSIDE
jgi:hypothetical protein